MGYEDKDLLVIDKFYSLLTWTSERVAQFPRDHKFTLGDRIQLRLFDMLELLVRAKFTRERVPLLEGANLQLELLRYQFRVAKDLRCLSVTSYGHACRSANEVGQLLGGWLKTSRAKR